MLGAYSRSRLRFAVVANTLDVKHDEPVPRARHILRTEERLTCLRLERAVRTEHAVVDGDRNQTAVHAGECIWKVGAHDHLGRAGWRCECVDDRHQVREHEHRGELGEPERDFGARGVSGARLEDESSGRLRGSAHNERCNLRAGAGDWHHAVGDVELEEVFVKDALGCNVGGGEVAVASVEAADHRSLEEHAILAGEVAHAHTCTAAADVVGEDVVEGHPEIASAHAETDEAVAEGSGWADIGDDVVAHEVDAAGEDIERGVVHGVAAGDLVVCILICRDVGLECQGGRGADVVHILVASLGKDIRRGVTALGDWGL